MVGIFLWRGSHPSSRSCIESPCRHAYHPRTMSQYQVEDRKARLARLRELGVDPYGRRFENITSLAETRRIGEGYKLEPGQHAEGSAVRVAGRVMLYRPAGKMIFITLRDGSGDLQVAVSKSAVSETEFTVASKVLSLGD